MINRKVIENETRIEENEGLGLIIVTTDETIGQESFDRYFSGGYGLEGLNGPYIQETNGQQARLYFTFETQKFPILETLRIEPGVLIEPFYLTSPDQKDIIEAWKHHIEDVALQAPIWLLRQMQKQALGYTYTVADNLEVYSDEEEGNATDRRNLQ